ncbi:Undecaprenyl diphosphate synthase [hydrothermal vent metagenome]|uniref:Undecaprenyl diphosphate synthase n=1 Tax=hydrothermal vent metagenome TaxID=652676 RepID=A0A3B0TEK8_9ZZZZ
MKEKQAMSTETARIVPASAPLALRIPDHIGVTMDGNGRWAQSRGLPRAEGHREGIKALRRLVEYCIAFQVPYVTVFSFSSENWRRPKSEIEFIFKLLKKFVASDLESLIKNNVRVRIIGLRQGLEAGLQKIIAEVEKKTAHNTGLNLNVAFNYGGRSEVVEAAKKLAKLVLDGKLDANDIDEAVFSGALSTANMPDPDLMLRTGGEHRISNFLIWQSAYAELVFLDSYWPDFNEAKFIDALQKYSARQRRFGGVEVENEQK